MTRGEWTTAHVGPEIQQTKHKREGTQIISRNDANRGGTNEMNRLFDQLEGRFGGLADAAHFDSIPPIGMPKSVFVESRRQAEQDFANDIKEKPRRREAKE